MKVLMAGMVLGGTLAWWIHPFEAGTAPDTSARQRTSILAELTAGRGAGSDWRRFTDPALSQRDVIFEAASWTPPEATQDLLNALRDLEQVKDPMIREMLLAKILEKLRERDANGGFEALAALGGTAGYAEFLGTYLMAWLELDPENAIEALRSLKSNEPLQGKLAKQACEGLSADHPRLVVDLVREFDLSFHGGSPIEKAFRALAEVAPEEAAKEAFAVRDGQAKTWAVANVFYAWSRSDPEAAMRHLQEQDITNPGHLSQWWNEIFSGWAETDPAAALAAIDSSAPARRETSLRFEVAKSWAQSAPEDALAWVAKIGDDTERKQMYGVLSSALAKEHPRFALEALLASGDPAQGGSLFATFAREDWEGTMATMGDWEDPELRAQAALSMLTHATYNHRALAEDEMPLLEWLAESPEILAEARAGSSQDFVQILSDGALAELETNHPEVYAALLPTIVRDRLIADDPVAVLDLVEELNEEAFSRRGEQHRQQAVSLWAQQEPESAAAWVETMPEGTPREFAFRNVSAAWASHDPEAARAWIETLTESLARDQAAEAFAESMARRDLESALTVAEMIEDRERRDPLLMNVWKQRLAADVRTAREELESATVPKSVRDELETFAREQESWATLGR